MGAELIHAVGRKEGLIDDLGRLFPGLVDRFWPQSPWSLCGVSLVQDAPVQGPSELMAVLCPKCFPGAGEA